MVRRPSASQRRSVSTETPSISAAWPTRMRATGGSVRSVIAMEYQGRIGGRV